MNAIPKPTRETRHRANLDTSDLVFSKAHLPRDAKYRSWVRTHQCAMTWHDKKCRGAVQAAHLEHGGRGIKGSDYSCIPLCEFTHHPMLDGQVLDWQVIAWLWRRLWELREAYRIVEAR